MTTWIRRAPVTVAIAAVTLACALATGALVGPLQPRIRADVALDIGDLFLRGRVLTLLTSVLVPSGPAELLLVLAALLVVIGSAERVLGSARTALAWLMCAVVGGLAGTAAQAAGLLARGLWTTPPATTLVLHPETPIIGVLLAMSASVGPLWRRRIRLVGFAALIVLLLYSGQPEDLDHLAGALCGLLLGVALTHRLPRPTFPRSSHHEARGLLAALVAVAAIGPIVAVVQPVGYGLLRPLGRLFRDPLPFGDRVHERCAAVPPGAACDRAVQLAHFNGPGAILLTVLPLLLLLVSADGIRRGRLAGAWLAAGVSGLLAVLAAVYYGLLPAIGDPDQIEGIRSAITLQSLLAVLVPLAIAVTAVRTRHHCPVLPTRRALAAAAVTSAVGVVTAALLYVGVGLLVRAQFTPRVGLLDLLAELPERFVPVGFLRFRRVDFVPTGPVAALLDGWVGAVAWLLLLAVAIGLLASARVATPARERVRLRALLRRGARGSIAWMATWPGNRTWFSADGRHAIAYRDGSGVALTVGEPVGEDDGAVEAARAFALHCDDRGLVPAFYAVRPEFAAALAGDGAAWSTLDVGEDTVVDPRTFSMRGRSWQDVRSSVNRADRAGVTAVWTDWASLGLARRAQIEAISEEWIADRRLPELGFTVGGVAELADPEVRLMLAVGPGDRVEAVTSWMPTWCDGEVMGLTLDFMRRRGGAMNGVTEFLIASVIGAAQQRGLRFVSLSVAPLATVDADPDDRLQRTLGAIARVLEPVYGFRSLATFKEKFRPAHVPQVVAFPDAVALPAVGLAVARAYLPERTLVPHALGRGSASRRRGRGAGDRPRSADGSSPDPA